MFLITLPLAVVALVMAVLLVPAHVNETTDPVDNLGGILSIVLVASVVLAINFAPVPDEGALVAGLAAIAVAAAIAFVIRQQRAAVPLYDLHIAGRRTFWVAACAGLVVFGTLMGAMFIGQQYLQNVLGYSTVEAGAAILPAVVMMVLIAPRSAKLVETPWRPGHAARRLRLSASSGSSRCCCCGTRARPTGRSDSATPSSGSGVGFAGTPASHSLTGSVPVTRAGMASGTADLQRDLGGAIMQSILGALLTAGYAAAVATAIADAPNADKTSPTASRRSCRSRSPVPRRSPSSTRSTPTQITAGARSSFLDGADWAYTAGIVAILLGAAIVYFLFPRRSAERALLAQYHAEDTEGAVAVTLDRS